jgi:imidazolonepropionase-like amidohydrolase
LVYDFAMKKHLIAVSASVFLWFVIGDRPSAQSGGITAFVGATVFDGTGAAPVDDAAIVVNNGLITAVGPASRVRVPPNARVIDLNSRTILPGFVNAHGHVAGSERSALEAQLLLYARYGVTSVFSLGGDTVESVPLRNADARGRARVFIAGPMIEATTAVAARKLVDQNAAMTTDWIKIRVDDFLGTAPRMPKDAWKAVIDRAHAHKIPVAAHIYYLDDAKELLREGVDFIAHSVRDTHVDVEFVQLARSRDVCVSPTLMREVSTFVYESTPSFFRDEFFLRYADQAAIARFSNREYQDEVRNGPNTPRNRAAFDQAKRNLKQLKDAGVRIAMGTDSGASGRFQGSFEHLELELMVDSGLTPAEAIVAATGDAARCMKKVGVIGTIQPGARADFVVYERSPLRNIRNSRSIESVWVGGAQVDMGR